MGGDHKHSISHVAFAVPVVFVVVLASGAKPERKHLILLTLRRPSFFFCHFLPKNRMSSPKTT
jgi:hypothetical protein